MEKPENAILTGVIGAVGGAALVAGGVLAHGLGSKTDVPSESELKNGSAREHVSKEESGFQANAASASKALGVKFKEAFTSAGISSVIFSRVSDREVSVSLRNEAGVTLKEVTLDAEPSVYDNRYATEALASAAISNMLK